MKRLALCCLLLTVGLLCRSPLAAAGKTESTDTPRPVEKMKPTDEPNQSGEKQQESPDTAQTSKVGNAAGSTQTEEIPADTAPADTPQAEKVPAETAKSAATNNETASSAGTGGKRAGTDNTVSPSDEAEKEVSTETAKSAATNSETASPAAGTGGKEGESGEPVDSTFASIHSKGLAVADGNKWYYESFDRQGRSAFGVLYEDGAAIEKTVWTYQGAARYPEQKKILRKESSEIFRYNEKGKELTVERYEGKNLASKTENVYNDADKLIEQTITAGKNIDRSVWEFVGDKAVTQTKYRNGKKTAFIELHSTPHIVHLYVDDKEVYVGEEQ